MAKVAPIDIADLQNYKKVSKKRALRLANQIRRSASSIPTNIAEGSVQGTDAQFARFLYVALGSAAELDYQILLAHELEYIDAKEYQQQSSEIDQIKKMLTAFVRKLKA